MRRAEAEPSYESLRGLRDACNQRTAFATPVTFLAFYRPSHFPVADKHTAVWWNANKARFGMEDCPAFLLRDGEWVSGATARDARRNWEAYLGWRRFCCDHASRVSHVCSVAGRARDVEMAVWQAQRTGLRLDPVPPS